MKGFFIAVAAALIATIAVFSISENGPSNKPPLVTPTRESASAIIARAEATLHDWEAFGRKKAELAPTADRTKLALEALASIKPQEPEHQAAQDVITKLRTISKKLQKQALNAEAAALGRKLLGQRKSYAATLQDTYLRKGQDFTIRTEGPNATILRIQWVLIGRPFVYNAINDRELMLSWKMMGFRTVIFSDGYNNTWRERIE